MFIKIVYILSGWNVWTTWSSCSTAETCGFGLSTRSRECDEGVAGSERLCRGDAEETKDCTMWNCEGMYRDIYLIHFYK